jgi:hypothetical protein
MARSRLKVGDKVRTNENHPLLCVTRRHVGVVDEVGPNCDKTDQEVCVKFRHKKYGSTIFQGEELRKVK